MKGWGEQADTLPMHLHPSLLLPYWSGLSQIKMLLCHPVCAGNNTAGPQLKKELICLLNLGYSHHIRAQPWDKWHHIYSKE